jgi:prophage antirepressor-like protein
MKAEESQTEGAQDGNLPVVFTFENHVLRTVSQDGETWFVAADVCKVLEHTDTSVAGARLDDDEKRTSNVCTNAGSRNMLTVSESGLYNLVFTSRMPKAREFRRWVTHDVLPSIRKTGRYEAGQQPADETNAAEQLSYARNWVMTV